MVFSQFLARCFGVSHQAGNKSRFSLGRSPVRSPQATMVETLDTRLTPTGLTAVPDSYTVTFDPTNLSPVNFDVLVNDTVGIGIVRITHINPPPYGCAMIRSPEGESVRYSICFWVPALYVGSQTFQYTTVDDSGATSTTSVSVMVRNRFLTDSEVNAGELTLII